jgi:phage replication O-like protein O
MASPQTKNGYTPIANEILEQIVKLPLNATQWRIIAIVWRFTYGFSRKEHDLSVSFIIEALGFNKKTQYKQVCRELKKLIEDKILIETLAPNKNTTRKLTFNKDHDLWSKKTTGLISPLDILDQTSKKTIGEETAENGDLLPSGQISPLVFLDHQENNISLKQNNIYILTSEEQELISVLESVKDYPLDREKETEMLKRLKQNYPSVDILETVKKWAIDKLDNPLEKKSSPRRQISTWCSNAEEWNKKRKVVNFDGRGSAYKSTTGTKPATGTDNFFTRGLE